MYKEIINLISNVQGNVLDVRSSVYQRVNEKSFSPNSQGFRYYPFFWIRTAVLATIGYLPSRSRSLVRMLNPNTNVSYLYNSAT